MSEPPPSSPITARSSDAHSILSEKLPPPRRRRRRELLGPEEWVKIAHDKVGLTLKGWRFARLLGVGPVSAAYEATRGVHDGASRGVVRLMVGSLAKNERARSHPCERPMPRAAFSTRGCWP